MCGEDAKNTITWKESTQLIVILFYIDRVDLLIYSEFVAYVLIRNSILLGWAYQKMVNSELRAPLKLYQEKVLNSKNTTNGPNIHPIPFSLCL